MILKCEIQNMEEGFRIEAKEESDVWICWLDTILFVAGQDEPSTLAQWPNARASLNVLLLEDVGECIPPARLNKEERGSVKFVSTLCHTTACAHESIGPPSISYMTSSPTSVFTIRISGTTTYFKPRSAVACHRSTRKYILIAS